MVTFVGIDASGGRRKYTRRRVPASSWSVSLAGRKVDFPGQDTSQAVVSEQELGAGVPVTGAASGLALGAESSDGVVRLLPAVGSASTEEVPGCHSTMRILVPKSLNSNRAR